MKVNIIFYKSKLKFFIKLNEVFMKVKLSFYEGKSKAL